MINKKLSRPAFNLVWDKRKTMEHVTEDEVFEGLPSCFCQQYEHAFEDAKEVYFGCTEGLEALDYLKEQFYMLVRHNDQDCDNEPTTREYADKKVAECHQVLPHETNIPKKEQGLFEKYQVKRTDGKPLKGGCIVLEWGDPNAHAGIREFMETVKAQGYNALAIDLANKLDEWEGKIVFAKLVPGDQFVWKDERYIKVGLITCPGAATDINAMRFDGNSAYFLHDTPVTHIRVGHIDPKELVQKHSIVQSIKRKE